MNTERQTLYTVELTEDEAIFRVKTDNATGREKVYEIRDMLFEEIMTGPADVPEDNPSNARGGEYSPKLCEDDIREIRRLYEDPEIDVTQKELAQQFGASSSQVGRIVRYEQWEDVT